MPAIIRNFLILCLFSSLNAAAQVPTANFTASPMSGCVPLTVQFNAATSTGNPTSYIWANQLANGTSVSTSNSAPSTTYTSAGTYTVQLQVANASGTSSIVTKTITVHDTPKVNFAATPTTGCSPLVVGFNSSSTIPGGPGPSTYQWVTAGGTPGITSGSSPSITYVNPGTYNVILTVTNSHGCFRSRTKTAFITATSRPTADFSAVGQTVFCSSPANASFAANPSGGAPPYTYDWVFGNNLGTSNLANPSFSFPGPGPVTYNVRLIVTDANGCKDTMLKQAFVEIKKHTANFTISPAAVCVKIPITFTNTSTTSITASNWYDGPSYIGNGSPVVPSFATPGVHNITLVSFDGPCTDTIVKQVTIHPQPTLNFSISPKYPCPPPNANVTFTPSGTSTSYIWDFGDGTPLSTATNPVHNYANPNYYCVRVIGTDSKGCKDTLTKVDSVRVLEGLLKINAPLSGQGCTPLSLTFSATLNGFTDDPPCSQLPPFPPPPLPCPCPIFIPYPFPITTYEWKFWDETPAATSSSATPTHVFDTCGIHLVTLKATTQNGCVFYDTFQVFAGTKPVANFTTSPTPPKVCANDTVHFTNTTTYPCAGQGNYSNEWNFGDGQVSFDHSPKYVYDDTAGTFCVRLITRYNGCEDTMLKCPLVVVDSPVAKFEMEYNCDTPLKIKFINKSYGFTSFSWDFGYPGGTSAQLNPVHTFPSFGTYNVRLVTYNSNVGCPDTFRMTIPIINPGGYITAHDTTICMDDKVHFKTGYTNPAHISTLWMWYVDDVFQTKDSVDKYTHTFNTVGYHSVKVVLRDIWGCIDTVRKTNWVLLSKPSVNFTATPTAGCVPLTTTFTDISAPAPSPGAALTNRFWNFGNGNTLSLTGITTPPQTYYLGGNYDVTLTLTDANGCKDSLTKTAFIKAYKPAAYFEADDTAACPDQVITFTNLTPGIANASWNFGDGTPILTAVSPTHAYTQTGTYTVTMIAVDSFGCRDTIVRSAYIKITKPTADFTMSDSLAICPPLVVTFTNNSSPGTYTWDFNTGTGPIVIPTSPVVEAFSTSKYYSVMLIVTDPAGCSDTAIRNINVLGYAGSFTYTPLTGCEPLEVTFSTTLTNIPSVTWDFNDGNTFTATNTGSVKHIYSTPGKYVPKLILSNGGGCTSSSLGLDTIRVDAAIAAYTHSPACEGYSITFTDSSYGYYSSVNSRLWTFHSGQVSTLDKVTRYYPQAGTYSVILAVINANGCKDTLYDDLVVHELPVIGAGSDTTICLNDAAQLQGTGGISYVWVPNTALSCADCPNPLASPHDSTKYYVIGTDINKCSDTDDVMVRIKLKVESEIGPGGEICDDESMMLEVSGARTYEWTPGESLDDNKSPTPKASPHNTTKYKVVAYEGSCIPDTSFVDVVVHPKPKIKASGGTTIIAGNETPLQAEGKDIKYFLWRPKETLSCDDCPDPLAKPSKTTTYTIIATTEEGCSDSDKVTINVLCDKSQLYIPNTFTPNGDGENDVFYPRGVGLDNVRSFRVYNRWGEIVYERSNLQLNDKAAGWDGNYKGQMIPPDVFVYIIEADCENGEVIKWKGDITLVR